MDDTEGTEPADAAPAEDDEPTDESDEVSDSNSVGDTVSMGDLDHTLHAARWDEGDEFTSPDDGERWLILDIELTNNSDDSSAISSLLMWQLVDEDNRSRDLEIFADTQGSLDGELGSGRAMRGEIAFEVADDQSSWELIFEPSVFGFGQAIYNISVDDID